MRVVRTACQGVKPHFQICKRRFPPAVPVLGKCKAQAVSRLPGRQKLATTRKPSKQMQSAGGRICVKAVTNWRPLLASRRRPLLPGRQQAAPRPQDHASKSAYKQAALAVCRAARFTPFPPASSISIGRPPSNRPCAGGPAQPFRPASLLSIPLIAGCQPMRLHPINRPLACPATRPASLPSIPDCC